MAALADKDFLAARVKTCEAMLSLLRRLPRAATEEHSLKADELYCRALAAGYRAQILFYKDVLAKPT